jgi:ABC-2 type transport system permease protein
VVFLIQPLVVVFAIPSSGSGPLSHEHLLLYQLGIPALVPVLIAAYAVVGEREQGTLEPMLSTPVRRTEFVVGKALAALLPSIAMAYAVFGVFIACVALFAAPGVPSALLQWPQIAAQLFFTPLIATWSIWLGMALSARAGDVRVAQQLGMLVALPTVVLTSLTAFDVIHPTLKLAVRAALLLLVLDALGWRFVSAAFNPERLITATR